MIRTNEKYRFLLPLWGKSFDCYEGTERVKAPFRREIYLPKVPSHHKYPKRYDAYVMRAFYENVYRPTINDIVGIMQRQNPTIALEDAPDPVRSLEYWGNEQNDGLRGLKERVNFLQVLYGRCGLLLDLATDAQGREPRFQIVEYGPHRICDGETFKRFADSRKELKWVLLDETTERFIPGTKSWEVVEQYRVLGLDANGWYYSTVIPHEAWGGFDLENPVIPPEDYPMLNGRRCDFVPFTVINATKIGINEFQPPPFLDLADTCLSMYHNSALLEQGLEFTANPTPYIIGATTTERGKEKASKTPEDLGAGMIINIPNPNAKVAFLEVSGSGMALIQSEIKRQKETASLYGVRALLGSMGANASGTALELRASSGSANIASIDQTGARGIEEQIVFACTWAGMPFEAIDEKIQFRANTEYLSENITVQSLVSLLQQSQGFLAKQTLYELLESISPGAIPDYETNLERMDEESDLLSTSIPQNLSLL